MEFVNVLQAAEWLERPTDIVKLKRMKDLIDNQRFYVTVWGHYSAGKSKLINNILDRDILPVQSRETTAVLTYIQYGTREECVFIYEDGTAESFNLSVLKDVFQNTSQFGKINKIDHIEAYINDDLLHSGLILVDTPGVNTVIQKHQDLAVDAIEQSGRIIYVLGGSPSNVDRQFIKQILNCGIQISFVRTKSDRFNETEENSEESLKKEAEELKSFIDTEIDFIPVSNEKNNKWYDNIEEVRNTIKKISNSIADEMKKASQQRLKIFSNQYRKDIETEEKHLQDIIKGNTAGMDAEIRKCESDIKVLEARAGDIEKKVEQRVLLAREDSQKDLDLLISSQVEAFARELSAVEPDGNVSDKVRLVYSNHLAITIEKIQGVLNTYFEGIIHEETKKLLEDVSDYSINVPVPTYGEVQQENSRILEMYNSRLQEIKQQIERTKELRCRNGENLSNAEDDFNESDYNEALALLDRELAEIPSGMALRLAEKQDIQPSSVFKAIGNAADIALLLIPGDVIFAGIKGLVDTTKIAQTVHKMGKAGEVILKAGTAVGKNAKAIDRVRDTAYALNTVMRKRRYSTQDEKERVGRIVDVVARGGQEAYETYKENKKSGSVLDVLSVAYWAEKLGRQFDSEPKMEIDREEQERRNLLRKQIAAEQQALCDERMKKRRELGLLKDKEAELKFRAQEDEVKMQKIEEEIRKQEETIKKQARQVAIDNYRKEYKNYYCTCITTLSNRMAESLFNAASQNITMYVASQNKELIDNITIKKNQLQELLELRDKGNEAVEKKIEECKAIKEKLELVY